LEVTLNVDLVDSLEGIQWSTTGYRTAPGYNGLGIGPTLRVKPGDKLTVTLNNNLPPSPVLDRELHEYVQNPASDDINATIIYNRLSANGGLYAPVYGYWGLTLFNLHFHGLDFSPTEEDLGRVVDGGESKTYTFKLAKDLEPGTYFYHDHVHGKNANAYMSGLMGFIIVEGTPYDLTASPGILGSREILLMLSEGLVNPNGSVPPFFPIVMQFNWTGVTNGHIGDDTVYEVTQGETIHFRAASASVDPTYRLSISDAEGNTTDLVLVSMDSFPLAQPQVTDVVTIGGGNRADFLARFDEPGTYELTRAAWSPLPQTAEFCNIAFQIPVYPCISYDVEKVVAIIIVAPDPDFQQDQPLVETIQLPPKAKRIKALAKQKSVAHRTISFDQQDQLPLFQIPAADGPGTPVGFGINGRLMQPNFREGTVTAGTCETWDIVSHNPLAEHPFHAHMANFMVTHEYGVEVEEPYWRDTLTIGSATIHICFDRVSAGDYVIVHCHLPSHLDIVSHKLYRNCSASRDRSANKLFDSSTGYGDRI
jgi:FtsP/CotA-like multicopper oxidase with cupredoxin domain